MIQTQFLQKYLEFQLIDCGFVETMIFTQLKWFLLQWLLNVGAGAALTAVPNLASKVVFSNFDTDVH